MCYLVGENEDYRIFYKKKPDILFQPEKSRTFAAIFY